MDWAKCIEKYDRPHTLFYCDPPYWQTEGYGVEFGFDHYVRMAELARTIEGKMLISVNDIPEMRHVFAGFSMDTVDVRYTMGGSGRSPSKQQELVIRNW